MNLLMSGVGMALRVTGMYRWIPDGGMDQFTLAEGAQVLILGCVEPGLQTAWDRHLVRAGVGNQLERAAGFRPNLRWLNDGGPCLAGIVPRMADDESYRDRIIEEEIAPLIGEHHTEHIIVLEHTCCAGRKILLGHEPGERQEEEHINASSMTIASALQRRFAHTRVERMVASLNGRHDAFRGVTHVENVPDFLARRELERNQRRTRDAERMLRWGIFPRRDAPEAAK